MAPARPLEILVYGSGAVGSIFGSRVQGTKARVTAVCRSNYDIARTRGIEIKSELWGNSRFRPDQVVRSPSEVSTTSFDYVVLATKSVLGATDTLARALSPIVNECTTLVSAQNGVTSELALRQCGFENAILSATCYVSCWQPNVGVVEQISHVKPHAFYIGKHSSGKFVQGDRELEALVALDKSFAKVEDAQRQRWEKMVFNAAWSPSCALFEKDTHGMLQDPAGVEIVRHLAIEAIAVGRAVGIKLPDSLVETTLSGPAAVPPIVPSMLQDLRLRRPLELEALCGGIIRYGRKYGIPVPVMEASYGALSKANSDEKMLVPTETYAKLAALKLDA